jgi:hypothetical protein
LYPGNIWKKGEKTIMLRAAWYPGLKISNELEEKET